LRRADEKLNCLTPLVTDELEEVEAWEHDLEGEQGTTAGHKKRLVRTWWYDS
jgi:hypothetical protein